MADHPSPPTPPCAEPAALLHRARRLPKVLLHEHLDGGLRPDTLLDLLRSRGLPAPADDVDALRAWFSARAHAGSLVEYLRGFGLTVAAMTSPEALSRVAFEAAEDALAEGCVLAEFRIAPLLFEPLGIPGEVAVQALLDGLARSALPSGLIVCAMRHESDAQIARAADLALQFLGRGVVGFDLAGAEAGWPATRHAALLARLRGQGLGLTLHAGEADGGQRVIEAAQLGATRVGHGVRLAELLAAPEWQDEIDALRTQGLHLEVCPTSNVHTGAAASLGQHPIRALWDAGLVLSFNTDNRLISGVDMPTEAANLIQHLGFGWADLLRMGLDAAQASFLPEAARIQARSALLAWAAAERLTPSRCTRVSR